MQKFKIIHLDKGYLSNAREQNISGTHGIKDIVWDFDWFTIAEFNWEINLIELLENHFKSNTRI